jgi:hypothetical protein
MEASATETPAGEHRIARNEIVRLFGTPTETVGSVNEPRQQHEAGFQYNERWIYDRPKNEPSRPKARVIYWQRYDFVASARIEQSGQWVRESPAELLDRHPDLRLHLPA